MKYICIYLWYVVAGLITLFLLIVYTIVNTCLLIWHFDYRESINWRRFMRRKFISKTYITDVDVISTFKRFAFISDEGEILCDKYCNEIIGE